jgi:endonuclease-3 related protein
MGAQKIDKRLQSTYRKLLEKYGPQHWWPAQESFEVIVGAILTQSTAWANVEKAMKNLKQAGVLHPEALRKLSPQELAGLIRPCGYYNVKAKRLKAFVRWLGEHDNYLDGLYRGDSVALRRRLLGVYGIGEETADSILLYAGQRPAFVIDAYTRRIIDRMGLTPSARDYAGYQKLFTSNLPEDVALFNEYHALLVRHAKEVCRQLPRCEICCLNPKEKSRKKTGGYPCGQG